MKTKKFTKALLSVVLVLAMLCSMCALGLTAVSAEGLSIKYDFAYKNAGYAEGRIRLENGDGTYFLYWADDTGALSGYHEIAVMSSDDVRPFKMGWGTAIPAGATKVIAIKSETVPESKTVADADAVFDIPAEKQFKGGLKQYSFEALSDIHIQHDDSYWYLSKPHFANALEVAAKRGVDFITICGDMVNGYGYSNLQKEYPQYLEIIAKSNYNNPIYETNGNHEIKGNGDKEAQQQDFELYRKYTGLNAAAGAVQTTPYYEKTINGDHYIFMVLELSGAPNESSEFTKAQLDWFEGLLKKYKNDGHKIFVNQHALIRGYGAGDNKFTPHYGGALVQDYDEVKRLMSIMEANPEIIMLNGHSHIDFKYGYNFDNEDGKTCYTVHIPSTSSTTQPDNGGALKEYDKTMHANSSQGYITDVYDDYVVFNGTDLAFNAIYPAYTYMVDYTGEELVMEDFGYETNKVTVDVSKLTDAPKAVICTVITETGDMLDTLPMTKNSDGTYSAEVLAEGAKVYFTINTDKGILKTSAFDNANCKISLGYQILTFPPTDEVNENVNAHFWGDGGNGTEWPGYAMTKDSSGNFVARIPASDYTGVVFNEGKSPAAKTGDLEIAEYLSSKIGNLYTTIADDDDTKPATNPSETQPATTKATEAVTTEVTTEATEITTEATTVATEPTETTVATEATEPEVTTIATEPVVTTLVTEITETTTSTIETTVYETTTVTATETTAPQVNYLYGDADLNGKVNVKDATTVQKHTAKMLTLEDVAYTQADVTGDGKVNIKDATAIQKYVAKIIAVFPVEESEELAMVGANGTLMAEVKSVLGAEYQYASYDAYMALKKAYMNNVSDDELNTVYDEFKKMKSKNPLASIGSAVTIGDVNIGETGKGVPWHLDPENNSGSSTEPGPEGEITVYFSNTNNWSVVKAYVWGSSPLQTWPGADMIDTGLESKTGKKKLYKITFDASKYNKIIFTNGSEQTVDITLPATADGTVYHLSTKEGDKYTVGSYAYSDKYQ